MALFMDSNSFYSLHLQDYSLEASKGSRISIGILRSKGFFLPRHRVRDFIGDHDPVSVLLHWTQATVLRK